MKERLRDFLREKNLNAKQFADEIGVQPSSISHILTGRNKPSIELLEKMIESFPEIDMRYLISGQKSVQVPHQEVETVSGAEKNIEKVVDFSDTNQGESPETEQKGIDRVMIFYANGTFSEYLPE